MQLFRLLQHKDKLAKSSQTSSNAAAGMNETNKVWSRTNRKPSARVVSEEFKTYSSQTCQPVYLGAAAEGSKVQLPREKINEKPKMLCKSTSL